MHHAWQSVNLRGCRHLTHSIAALLHHIGQDIRNHACYICVERKTHCVLHSVMVCSLRPRRSVTLQVHNQNAGTAERNSKRDAHSRMMGCNIACMHQCPAHCMHAPIPTRYLRQHARAHAPVSEPVWPELRRAMHRPAGLAGRTRMYDVNCIYEDGVAHLLVHSIIG